MVSGKLLEGELLTMKYCANRNCHEWISDNATLCLSCRFIARWAFGLGAFMAGAIATIIKLFS